MHCARWLVLIEPVAFHLLATLGDAGHMLPLTHPQLCNELIEWHVNGAGRALPDHAA